MRSHYIKMRDTLSLGAITVLAAFGNTARGQGPSTNDTTDFNLNTGSGTATLSFLNGGKRNSAFGFSALYSNTTGSYNTASGGFALRYNTTGVYNAAVGYNALYGNGSGSYGAALGSGALQANTSGAYNSATGYNALYLNTTGAQNSAVGSQALYTNNTGDYNAAVGVNALYKSVSGNYNVAMGRGALKSNTTGGNNIGVGHEAGTALTTGSNNIDIGSAGVAAESNVIRLGTVGRQTATYVAGIDGTAVTGSAVYVSSTGRLGVVVSSERYKSDIAGMGARSAKLQQLRPVTLHLKTDPKGSIQYGLIAEEVAKVYPELVIRGEGGRIDGVRYDELAPMLLNEIQQQQKRLSAQASQLAEVSALKRQLAAQGSRMAHLEELLVGLQAQAQASQVAMR